MTGAYEYTPQIWPLVFCMLLATALGLYSWRRRAVPGAPLFSLVSLVCVLMALSVILETAAVDPDSKILWHKIRGWALICGLTCGTTFILAYANPGRWLTRRTLSVLWIPLLLYLLVDVGSDGRLSWRSLHVGPEGAVDAEYATAGLMVVAYGLGLTVVNMVALIWLFIHSPQHRWPAALMLCGQITNRGLFLLGLAQDPAIGWINLDALELLIAYTTFAVALFGFHIFDPIALARQTAIEQIASGMLVLDVLGRVVSINPAAERILSISAGWAKGRPIQELLPAFPAEPGKREAELSLGAGDALRHYLLAASPLEDGRGIEAGRLLLLHDVTAQRQAQAQILEQQRTMAMLQERERLARELHDSLGQVFAFISTQGQAIRRLLGRGDIAGADAHVARLVEIARESDTDIRESILALRVSTAERGLLPALVAYLQQYEQRYAIHTELSRPETLADDAFEPLAETHLLRIVQEALTNARKHARARSVAVSFALHDGCAQVTVCDDGCGFDRQGVIAGADGHVGLRVMHERAKEIGGSCVVQSAPGKGTHVIVTVPVRR